MAVKRLYRSGENRVIAGVCGGLGEYFEADPLIIRIIWLLATIFTAFIPGVIAYLVCWILIPEK